MHDLALCVLHTPKGSPPLPSFSPSQRIAEGYELWAERSRAVVEQGGRLAEDLEDLLAEGEQYLWGGEPPLAKEHAGHEVEGLRGNLWARGDAVGAAWACVVERGRRP
jgi:hypothetical protein